jgi:Domain of unknown function (DUF4145)
MVKTKIAISLCVLTLIILHLARPTLRIDYITVCLAVVAALPWLSDLVHSIEIPGGFKIELRDVKNATRKVLSATPPNRKTGGRQPIETDVAVVRRLRPLAVVNPRLALVGIRIETEETLRAIAQKEGIQNTAQSAGSLLRELEKRGKLPSEVVAGLRELISLGNRAAHGTNVTQEAAEWALDHAPGVLAALNPDYIAFLHVFDSLDHLLLDHLSLPAPDLWHQPDFWDALDRLKGLGIISGDEERELQQLHALRWDIRVGFGDWDGEATRKLPMLTDLYSKISQRLRSSSEKQPNVRHLSSG